MLSDNLSALYMRLREYEHTGLELSPEGVDAVCAILAQAVLDAGALERQLVPHPARVDPAALPGNVVALRPEREPAA